LAAGAFIVYGRRRAVLVAVRSPIPAIARGDSPIGWKPMGEARGGALSCGDFGVSAGALPGWISFIGGEAGFDAVLGARGSQLQLVLNAVFHLETSPGNIPWTMYEQLRRDPRVKLAIPYAVGDSYRGFRIVGTTSNIFTEFEYSHGRKFQVEPGGVVE
jgi:hypothetical protein